MRVVWPINFDAFCVLSGMGLLWSTHAEIHFVSSLASDAFVQYMLRCILCSRWNEIGLVYTYWDKFCVLPAMGGVCSTQVGMHFVSSLTCEGFDQLKFRRILCHCWQEIGLVNTCWDTFCFFAGTGGIWSTQVEIHFVSSLHGRGLIYTSWGTFCLLIIMRCVLSTLV